MIVMTKNGNAAAVLSGCAFVRVAKINKGARSEDEEKWELRAFWSSGLNLKILEDTEAACRDELKRMTQLLNEEQQLFLDAAATSQRLGQTRLGRESTTENIPNDEWRGDIDE